MQYILNMEIERYTPACGSRGLAPTAESNDAPGDLVERLRSLGDEDFSGPDQIMTALKRS